MKKLELGLRVQDQALHCEMLWDKRVSLLNTAFKVSRHTFIPQLLKYKD